MFESGLRSTVAAVSMADTLSQQCLRTIEMEAETWMSRSEPQSGAKGTETKRVVQSLSLHHPPKGELAQKFDWPFLGVYQRSKL